MEQAREFETKLAAERPRLVRLCAHLSGNWDAAEDLAQETLLQAWHCADRLREQDQATLWLSGIARNVCLNWSRGHYRDQARIVQPAHVDSANTLDVVAQLHDDFDLEFELERQELVTLLDQALALLPPETRTVLVQKYVEESPYAEIAERLGLSENAVAVRAHRGKLAFQRVLANELRTEALAHGLLDNESDLWEETRIWCQQCGNRRLLGRFQKCRQTGVFELRCPTCCDGSVGTRADLSIPFFADLLGNVKTYKPAYTRLLTSMSRYCRQALETQRASCLACGHETSIWLGARDHFHPAGSDGYEVRIHCHLCGLEINNALVSFAMILPESQRFWRVHSRLCTLPAYEIEANGTPAFVTRLRNMTDQAGLDVILVRDTLEPMGVYSVRNS